MENSLAMPSYLATGLRHKIGEVKASTRELMNLCGESRDFPPLRNYALMTIALREAVERAKLTPEQLREASFINSTTVGGMDYTELQPMHGDFLRYNDCGVITGLAAEKLNIRGLVTTISTACSSAANALAFGAELIEAGETEICIAGGCESFSKFHLNGFKSLGVLSEDICRPFEDARDGINLGEGAAYLILESEESAKRRGAEILGYLNGWGNACDAFHATATSPEATGPKLAIEYALADAGLKPGDIDYINAHGTGTQNNDETELRAYREVFGADMPPFASTKPLTGHTTSACAAIEAIFCLMGLNGNFYPGLDLKPSKPVINTLCCAFGFGGNDSALIFSKA